MPTVTKIRSKRGRRPPVDTNAFTEKIVTPEDRDIGIELELKRKKPRKKKK